MGAVSVLDLSGDAKPFEALTDCRTRRFEGSWDAIGRDFEAIGRDLDAAIVRYFETLPRERQMSLLRGLIEHIERTEAMDASPPLGIMGEAMRYLKPHNVKCARIFSNDERRPDPSFASQD